MATQGNHQNHEVSVKFMGIELTGKGKWGIVAALGFGMLVTTWLTFGIG